MYYYQKFSLKNVEYYVGVNEEFEMVFLTSSKDFSFAQKKFPDLIYQSDFDISLIIKELSNYFENKHFDFTKIKMLLVGTNFQKSIWLELLKIPYGKTKSYQEIAKLIGNEKAFRAVANAIGQNPIYIIVPCHRVIGSKGKLVGYRGGIEIKEMLLNSEKNILS